MWKMPYKNLNQGAALIVVTMFPRIILWFDVKYIYKNTIFS